MPCSARLSISSSSRLGERHPLGRPLDLDEPARRRHDHVHVDLGPAVLLVGEVEHAHPVDHADRHGGHGLGQRVGPQGPLLDQTGQRVVEGHVGPADGRRAGPPVGLQHVAVHGDLQLAEGHHVADRPQRAADQPLDLLGPTRLLPLAASRVDPLAGRPGSSEYSAVTQPLPEPRIHGGTRSSTDAVHSTRVRPMETRTEPGAKTVKSRSNAAVRSSSIAPAVGPLRRSRARSQCEFLSGRRLLHRAAEGGLGLLRHGCRVHRGPPVGDDQAPGLRRHGPPHRPAGRSGARPSPRARRCTWPRTGAGRARRRARPSDHAGPGIGRVAQGPAAAVDANGQGLLGVVGAVESTGRLADAGPVAVGDLPASRASGVPLGPGPLGHPGRGVHGQRRPTSAEPGLGVHGVEVRPVVGVVVADDDGVHVRPGRAGSGARRTCPGRRRGRCGRPPTRTR